MGHFVIHYTYNQETRTDTANTTETHKRTEKRAPEERNGKRKAIEGY